MDQQELTVGLNATDEDFLQGVKAVDENDGDVTDSLVVESVSNFLGGGRRLVVYAAVDRQDVYKRQVSTSVRSSGFNSGFPSKKHALKRSAKRLLSFQKFFRMVSGVILLFTFVICVLCLL